jgi:phospholipase C
MLAGGLGVGLSMTPGMSGLVRAAAATCPAGSDIGAIEHVVFLLQENRSFDHYFGTYRGSRGFGDHPPGKLGAFAQPYPTNTGNAPVGKLLPFHLDTATAAGACVNDISHEWTVQHASWNHGAMDGFGTSHIASDGPAAAVATMGHYRRSDLGFLYALADTFTLCDGYHSSIMGPTVPNRLYSISATIDPAGIAGGPVVQNPGASQKEVTGEGLYSWKTMPEVLTEHGVTWKTYSQLGTNNNVLVYFPSFATPGSANFTNGLLPTWPATFEADVQAGTLPQVSWVLAPTYADEHPSTPSAYGMNVTARVLSALVANPAVWAKTALFLAYDENGGFFDHVSPPVPPPGTAGEHLTVTPLPPEAGGVAGPIGLGFRVPALMISPFSRGGRLCPDTFDHTSMLRFLETRFGTPVPNLTEWRRRTVGDLTTTLDMSTSDASAPTLPDTVAPAVAASATCGIPGLANAIAGQLPVNPGVTAGTNATVPSPQSMPTQEPGPARPVPRAKGRCAGGPNAPGGAISAGPGPRRQPGPRPAKSTGGLPATGGPALSAQAALTAVVLGLVALRRRQSPDPQP